MSVSSFFFFFFNDTATTEIYTFPYTTLFRSCSLSPRYQRPSVPTPPPSYKEAGEWKVAAPARSEEHTSELQSQSNLVCRLLLEKTNPISIRPSSSYRY